MEKYNSKATADLVLGIISVVLAFLYHLAIPALVCGIIASGFASEIRSAADKEGFKADGKTTAALVLGIIGLSFSALRIISCISCYSCVYSNAFDLIGFHIFS